MSRSTKSEERMNVAMRCALLCQLICHHKHWPPPELTVSNCFATHRIWQIWTPLTSICCKTEKKFVERRKIIDDNDVICTANGWLEDHHQKFFYNGIQALENRWTKCISVEGKGTMLKNDKISCSYSVVNYIRLRTFWTPLVCYYLSCFCVR